MPDKEKSTGILGGLRAFLTQYGANLHHFQAIIPYGVSPNAPAFSYVHDKKRTERSTPYENGYRFRRSQPSNCPQVTAENI